MKVRTVFVSVVAVLLALTSTAGWSQHKYVPKADDVFFGTWINLNAPIQKAVNFPGGWRHYTGISDGNPSEEGTEEIMEEWTDSEGNVWCKTFGTETVGPYKGHKFQELYKFSKSGTVRETTWNPVYGEIDETLYPTRIDPTNQFFYSIYFRAED